MNKDQEGGKKEIENMEHIKARNKAKRRYKI